MKWLLVAILLVLIGIAFPVAWIITGPLLVVVIIAGIISSIFGSVGRLGSSRQSTCSRIYKATREGLFEQLLRIVSDLGHRLQNANKGAGLVVFKTRSTVTTPSGYEGSVVAIPMEDGACEVRIAMGYKGQLWDWGEGQKIARAIFRELDKEFTVVIRPEEEDEEPEDNPVVEEFRFWRSIFRSDPARNKKERLGR